MGPHYGLRGPRARATFECCLTAPKLAHPQRLVAAALRRGRIAVHGRVPSLRQDRVAEVARLAGPAIVAGLVSTVVFFSDRLMLGWVGPTALGSMQLSAPVVWSVHSVFGVFAVGLLAVVGRATGAGDGPRAQAATSVTLALGLLVGLVVSALGVALSGRIAVAMAGAAPDMAPVRDAGAAYMRVVFAATGPVFLAVAGIAGLQARGDTRTPMRIAAITGVVNFAASAALIFGVGPLPALGVVGAAAGSAVAFVLQAALVVVALVRRGALAPWAVWGASWRGHLQPIVSISGPALGERLIFHAGFLLFAGIVARLGADATAANQSLVAIESVGFISANGFGVAAGALVAQKLGAGRPDDAEAMGWTAAAAGGVALGVVSVVFWMAPELLVGAFSDDPAIVAMGVRCLRVAAFAQPLMAITDALAFSLRGAGDTRSPMLVALVGPVLVRLSACWLLAVHLEMGLLGIWIGTTLDWGVRVVWLAWIFSRGRWKGLAAA